ncbi:MAG: ABC transporter ATP-binding protein [Oscillospiraceae bacterium]|nr:ABC transporter ATP-binding protein [Oscillospiraceae bacterium]
MLEIRNLRVSFHTYSGEVQAVRGVDLTVPDHDITALVGESGCGKSMTAQTVVRLHDMSITEIKSGEILLDGVDLLKLSDREMQQVRGRDVGMIFQDPMTSLNPTMTVGAQIAEVILQHAERDERGRSRITKAESMARAEELLREVKLPDPEKRVHQYPHEFSGGQRQRIMIAIAMACHPRLLIADEPTTALDVTVQAQILELMRSMQQERQASIIIITHDLGVVANFARHVSVMYGGMIVESGTTRQIYEQPEHPYTHALLKAIPSKGMDKRRELTVIEGIPPDLIEPPVGCPFADRCPCAMQVCREHLPPVSQVEEGHSCRCWLLDPDCPPGMRARRRYEDDVHS